MSNIYIGILTSILLAMPLFSESKDTNNHDSAKETIGNKTDSFNIALNYMELQKISRLIKKSALLTRTIKRDYPQLLYIKGFHPVVGYSYNGLSFFNAGVGYGKRNILKPLTYHNLYANMMFSSQTNGNIWGHEIGYSISKMLFYTKIGVGGYYGTNMGETYTVKPEIGFTLSGIFNIGYGYHFMLNSNPIGINTHSLNITYTHQFLKRSLHKKIREVYFIISRDVKIFRDLGTDFPFLNITN